MKSGSSLGRAGRDFNTPAYRLDKNRILRQIIILVAICVCLNSFFLTKAFHIDDTFTITISRAISQNPLHPSCSWGSNPIILGYYFAPLIRLFGESEWVMHLFYLPFTILAVAAMYFISLRFTGCGMLPALSLFLTPAFLISSQSIMLDIPLLAFSLAALAVFIWGIDNNQRGLLFCSGVLVSIAVLIKYSGLLFIGVMAIYAVCAGKRRALLYLCIPLLLFAGWAYFNLAFYKIFPFIGAAITRFNEMIAAGLWHILYKRFFTLLSFLSGTSLLPFIFLPLLLRDKSNLLLLLASLPVAALPFIERSLLEEYGCFEKAALAVFVTTSFFIIFWIIKGVVISVSRQAKDSRDIAFLALWFAILAVFITLIQFISARFIMLLFPPLIMLLFKGVRGIKLASAARGTVIAASTAMAVLSVALAIGDYYFAGIYRDSVFKLSSLVKDKEKAVFSQATYSDFYAWGYSYYVSRAYPNDNYLTKENISAAPYPFYTMLSQEQGVLPIVLERIRHPEREYLVDEPPLTCYAYYSNLLLHNRKHRVGFYSYDWGFLPFKILLHPVLIERFCVYRVKGEGFIAPAEIKEN
jgi:4-amino-4-deoxy-L-arabinose transferase-like glycosyltransferase